MEAAVVRLRSTRMLIISATGLALAALAVFLAPQTLRGITSTQFLPHAY